MGLMNFRRGAGRKTADEPPKELSPEVEKIKDVEELDDIEEGFSETKKQYMQRGLTAEEADFLLSLSEKEKSQIYRKVDYRLVPMLALLYLISHLDRANIGNAKIEGMEDDLGMSDLDYNIAVCGSILDTLP